MEGERGESRAHDGSSGDASPSDPLFAVVPLGRTRTNYDERRLVRDERRVTFAATRSAIGLGAGFAGAGVLALAIAQEDELSLGALLAIGAFVAVGLALIAAACRHPELDLERRTLRTVWRLPFAARSLAAGAGTEIPFSNVVGVQIVRFVEEANESSRRASQINALVGDGTRVHLVTFGDHEEGERVGAILAAAFGTSVVRHEAA